MDSELARQQGEDYNPYKQPLKRSDLIFVGKAMNTMKKVFDSSDSEPFVMEVKVDFHVTQTIKGPHRDKVAILSSRESIDCACVYNFEAGVEYLVFASEVKNQYRTFFCHLISPKETSIYSEIINQKG